MDDKKIIAYPRCNGKSFSDAVSYISACIIEAYRKMMAAYPDKRVVYHATHGKPRTRRKNCRRIIKWYEKNHRNI